MTDTDYYGRPAVALELIRDVKLVLSIREGDLSPFVLLQTSDDDHDIDGENLWAFMQAWRAAHDHWASRQGVTHD